MTALDEEIGPEVVDILAEYGTEVTLTRVTVGAFNAATGKVANTSSTETIKVYPEDYSAWSYANNSLLKKGSKKFYAAALGLVKPEPGCKVTYKGKVYTVTVSDEIASGDEIALYIIRGELN